MTSSHSYPTQCGAKNMAKPLPAPKGCWTFQKDSLARVNACSKPYLLDVEDYNSHILWMLCWLGMMGLVVLTHLESHPYQEKTVWQVPENYQDYQHHSFGTNNIPRDWRVPFEGIENNWPWKTKIAWPLIASTGIFYPSSATEELTVHVESHSSSCTAWKQRRWHKWLNMMHLKRDAYNSIMTWRP